MLDPARSNADLVIATEPKISGSPRPPVTLTLPIICKPRRALMAVYSVLLLAIAALGLLLVALAFASPSAFHSFILMLAIGAFAFAYFGGLGAMQVVDLLRAGPALLIDASGLEDRRQGIRVQWTDVVEGRLRPSRVGIAHVALRTRSGFRHLGSPFRVGASPRRRDDDVLIPLQFLAPSPHVTALAISALLERSGSSVLGKPWWADRNLT